MTAIVPVSPVIPATPGAASVAAKVDLSNVAATDFSAKAFVATGGAARGLATRFSDTLNARDYGATGDGSTDDTAALQAAFSAISGKRLVIPAGTYRISEKLTIPSGANGFEIMGEGRCVLRQDGGNMPAIFFAEENSYFFRIHGLRFQWGDGAAAIPTSHTSANCIVFSGAGVSGAGFYDFELSRLRNLNGYHLITTDPAKSNTTIGFWGGQIRNLFAEGFARGCVIRMRGQAGGYPAVSIDRIYQVARYAVEPCIDIQGHDSWTITNVERNAGGQSVTDTPKLIRSTSGRNLRVTGIRVENEWYQGSALNGSGLVQLDNTSASLTNIRWNAPNAYSLASSSALVTAFNNGGQGCSISIDQVTIAKNNSTAISSFAAGSLYVVDVNTAGGGDLTVSVGRNINIDDYRGSAFVRKNTGGMSDTVVFPHGQSVVAASSSVTGSKSAASMTIQGGSAWYPGQKRSLVSLRLISSAALSGSSLQVAAYKNGSAIGGGAAQVTISSGGTSAEAHWDPISPTSIGTAIQFLSADKLELKLDTLGGTLTSTTDLTAVAVFA